MFFRSSKVGSQQSKVTQKTDVTSSEEIPHVIEKEGVVLPTMLSNHFTLNSIKEDQNSNKDGPTAKQETILEGTFNWIIGFVAGTSLII